MIFAVRIIIGITFIYSSFGKIQDPAGFAKIIYGYDIFPLFSINLLALIVPFVELTSGFCILFRVAQRPAVLMINAMLVMFIAIISFNLLRGHQFDCGCFSNAVSDDPFVSNIISMVRDVFLLVAAGWFYFNLPHPDQTKT